MLVGKYWLTNNGAFEVTPLEHWQFAAGIMLNMGKSDFVPGNWIHKGIPSDALQKALDRGADPRAIEFLSNPKSDSRLYALREFGWIRTVKNAWDLWDFDKATAKLARDNTGYWKAQKSMHEYEIINVNEFKTGERYQVSAAQLLAGGSPKVLKGLSTVEEEEVSELVSPTYSTLGRTEEERRRLYGRTGDNPRKRRK